MTANQPTDQPTSLTIDQAAVALGISREAVRLRLRRGTLHGLRSGGRWYVQLDHTDQPTATDQATNRDRPTRSTDQREQLELRLAHAEEMIATLRAERDRLARQVEQDAVERAELRRLLVSVLLPMTTLPAPRRAEPAEKPPVDVEPAETVRRPWWRFW
jgi:hypothetical protein